MATCLNTDMDFDTDLDSVIVLHPYYASTAKQKAWKDNDMQHAGVLFFFPRQSADICK